jgi:hypothetical protein
MELNLLTNIIPYESLIHIKYLYLSNNYFTGFLPQLSQNSTSDLIYLYLNDNLLTGSIAVSLGNFSNLEIVDLSDNYLTNSINIGQFNNLINLRVLFLTNNILTGKLNNVFNKNLQKKINNIDISQNIISGSIPSEIFEIKSLKTFAAVKNCIEGVLPLSMCNCSGLTTLALDGLKSADKCQVSIYLSIYLFINIFPFVFVYLNYTNITICYQSLYHYRYVFLKVLNLQLINFGLIHIIQV